MTNLDIFPLIVNFQAMLLKKYEFCFATSAADVGMKTGATIHTMNGLNMYVRRRKSNNDAIQPSGWWEEQHLSRGLDVTGKPYETTEDAAWETYGRGNLKTHTTINDDNRESP